MTSNVQVSIETGSIHRSLHIRFVSYEEVLSYLLNNREVTPRRIAAYRAVCSRTDTTSILLGSKSFLEIYNPIEYQLISIYCNRGCSLADRRDWACMQQGIEAVSTASFISMRMSSICVGTSFFSDEFKDDVLLNEMQSISKNTSILEIIDCDHAALMNMYDTVSPEDVTRRCLHLIDTGYNYWLAVGKNLYLALIRIIPLSRIDYSTHSKLLSIFEDYGDAWIRLLSEEAYLIYRMKSPLREYMLGFDILGATTSLGRIRDRLSLLSKAGTSNYCKLLKEERRGELQGLQIINEYNLFGDCVHDYSPFDRVTLREGDKVHVFTREEFDGLCKSGKNPYTNQPLPVGFLYTISSRMSFSRSHLKVGSLAISERLNGSLDAIEDDSDSDEVEDLISTSEFGAIMNSINSSDLRMIFSSIDSME